MGKLFDAIERKFIDWYPDAVYMSDTEIIQKLRGMKDKELEELISIKYELYKED